MNLINIEVKPTPSIISAIGTVVFLFFTNILGLFVSICFCLASLFLFIAFLIIPLIVKDKDTNLHARYYRHPPDYYQKAKIKMNEQYTGYIQDCYKIAVAFYIVGIIVFVISHL